MKIINIFCLFIFFLYSPNVFSIDLECEEKVTNVTNLVVANEHSSLVNGDEFLLIYQCGNEVIRSSIVKGDFGYNFFYTFDFKRDGDERISLTGVNSLNYCVYEGDGCNKRISVEYRISELIPNDKYIFMVSRAYESYLDGGKGLLNLFYSRFHFFRFFFDEGYRELRGLINKVTASDILYFNIGYAPVFDRDSGQLNTHLALDVYLTGESIRFYFEVREDKLVILRFSHGIM